LVPQGVNQAALAERGGTPALLVEQFNEVGGLAVAELGGRLTVVTVPQHASIGGIVESQIFLGNVDLGQIGVCRHRHHPLFLLT